MDGKIWESIVNWENAFVVTLGIGITFCCYLRYKKTKSRPLITCLPGVFTSLGLLGTFFAICISLNGLDDKIDITEIIKKLIPAFTSSIIGLLFALIATVWAKMLFAKEDAEDDRNMQNISPEQYIREIAINTKGLRQQHTQLFAQLVTMQREQEEKNREYSEKLEENIKNQNNILKEFIENFANRIDDVFKQMRSTIQNQVEILGEEQLSRTSEILVSITDRLSSVSNEIINSQSQSVREMMENTNDEIGGITSNVTTALGNLSERLQESLTKLEEQQSSVVENALDMNRMTTDNLRTSINDFTADVQSSISDHCTTLNAAITANVESLKESYQFIEEHTAEICQNYDQSVLAYRDAVNIVHRTNETTEKTILATNISLESVEETNNRINEVLEILSNRQENIEQLTRQISSVSATIEQLQNLESQLNKIANQ